MPGLVVTRSDALHRVFSLLRGDDPIAVSPPARAFRAPGHHSKSNSLTRSRSSEQSSHSVLPLASLREEAAPLPTLLRLKSRVQASLSALRSLPRLRSTEQRPHNAPLLSSLRKETVLLRRYSITRRELTRYFPDFVVQRDCARWSSRRIARIS